MTKEFDNFQCTFFFNLISIQIFLTPSVPEFTIAHDWCCQWNPFPEPSRAVLEGSIAPPPPSCGDTWACHVVIAPPPPPPPPPPAELKTRLPQVLNPRWLTTELPAPVVGLGGPSGSEHDPSQDLLRVSFSRGGREPNPWRDASDFMPLT